MKFKAQNAAVVAAGVPPAATEMAKKKGNLQNTKIGIAFGHNTRHVSGLVRDVA